MRHECRLSNTTKKYLERFYCILDEMINEMNGADITDSISRDFIVQMIPHHKAAIEMSENILRYTTNIPLQDIAANIISEQTKGIENMLEAERECSLFINSASDTALYTRYNAQILTVMFDAMGSAPAVNNINVDFMREMIPHHRGAIEMSKNALRFGICRKLIPILNGIITSQERGIAQMRQLLKKC